MRKTQRQRVLFAFAAFLVFSSTGAAKTINWRTDHRKAVEESVRLEKPILVRVGANWCGYCVKMERETFTDRTVARHVNTCFVPLALDADSDSRMVASLGITSFPTTLVISPKMQVVQKIVGFRTANQLEGQLKRLCQHSAETGDSATVLNESSQTDTQPQALASWLLDRNRNLDDCRITSDCFDCDDSTFEVANLISRSRSRDRQSRTMIVVDNRRRSLKNIGLRCYA